MASATPQMKQLFWCPERHSYVNLQGQVEMVADHGRLVGEGTLYPTEEHGSFGSNSSNHGNNSNNINNNTAAPAYATHEGVVRVDSESGAQGYRYDPYSTADVADRSAASVTGDSASHGHPATYGTNSEAGLSDCVTMDGASHAMHNAYPQGYDATPRGSLCQGQMGGYVNASPSHSLTNQCSGTPSVSSHGSSPGTSPQSRAVQGMPPQHPQYYDATTPPPPLLPSESKTFAMAMHTQAPQGYPTPMPQQQMYAQAQQCYSQQQHYTSVPPSSSGSSGCHTPPQSVEPSPHRATPAAHSRFPMDPHAAASQPHNSHMVMATAQPVQCTAAQTQMACGNGGSGGVHMPPQAPPSRMAMENAAMAPPVACAQQQQQQMQCPPSMPCDVLSPPPMFQRDVKVLVEFKHGRRAVCVCDGDVVDLENLPSQQYNLVEGDRGHDICRVLCLSSPRLHNEKAKNKATPRVLRPASQEEVEYWQNVLEEEEQGAKALVNKLIAQAKLPLTVTHASYQIDRKKLTFYYESPEHQPDFRCLLSECYAYWKCRIWFTNLPRRHYKNQSQNRVNHHNQDQNQSHNHNHNHNHRA